MGGGGFQLRRFCSTIRYYSPPGYFFLSHLHLSTSASTAVHCVIPLHTTLIIIIQAQSADAEYIQKIFTLLITYLLALNLKSRLIQIFQLSRKVEDQYKKLLSKGKRKKRGKAVFPHHSMHTPKSRYNREFLRPIFNIDYVRFSCFRVQFSSLH